MLTALSAFIAVAILVAPAAAGGRGRLVDGVVILFGEVARGMGQSTV